MTELTGQNIVDYMQKGIKADLKDHVVGGIANDLVQEFRETIQVNATLKLLIEWKEAEKERKVEYELQSKVV